MKRKQRCFELKTKKQGIGSSATVEKVSEIARLAVSTAFAKLEDRVINMAG